MVDKIDSCKTEAIIGLRARLDQIQKQQEPMNLIIEQSKKINNTLKSILKLSQDHSSYVALLKSLQHEKASLLKQDSQLYSDMISNCGMIK